MIKRRKFEPPGARAGAPLAPLPQPTARAGAAAPSPAAVYLAVLYCKRSSKKRANKSFADAILEVKGGSLALFDAEGKPVCRGKGSRGFEGGAPEGATGELGGWEFEVVEEVSAAAFASGACFVTTAAAALTPSAPTVARTGLPSRPPPAPLGGSRAFRPPAVAGAPCAPLPPPPKPLFDPAAPDALVLNPTAAAAGTEVAVSVDPFVRRRLRPHQAEGLVFLWGRLGRAGATAAQPAGAVLADEVRRERERERGWRRRPRPSNPSISPLSLLFSIRWASAKR